jgi:hypothetical protein
VLLVFWGVWHARRTFSRLDDAPAEGSLVRPTENTPLTDH